MSAAVMSRTAFVLFLLLHGHLSKACTEDELVFLQVISRHGSTSPKFLYPTNPNPKELWKEGLDDLTMLGKFQPYALGSFLRARYEKFITSDPIEVEVFSSAKRATVKSAQSLVTALYAPNPYWEVVKNFSWQPIYIKYENEDEGKYFSKPFCLAADTEYEQLLARDSDVILQTYQTLIQFWQTNSGLELKNIEDVEKLFDILKTEAIYNLTIPEWAKNSWNDMRYLHDLSYAWKFKTRHMQRLRGGPLVDLTLKTMKKKAAGDLENKKVYVYSTHDFNIAAFLSTMGMWNYLRPEPSATILIELYEHENNYFVRYLYLNSTMPEREPQYLNLLYVPGCIEFCPLSYVINLMSNMIPKDWDGECLLL
ncbi:Prostatic acid phosphatase, partial [Stegodyphus mimosarum]